MSTTDAGHHVENTKNLLQAAPDSDWRSVVPSVREYWADAQSERGPGAGQPPVCYVWSPTDSTLDRFSIDDSEKQQTNTIEIQVWSLDPTEAVTVQEDVTRILSGYMDDNKTETPYSTVEPVVESDFREQKNARSTDHYITAVEIETEGLTEAGVA